MSDIHGSLLLGQWGDWIVELAASWAIVLILSGLYLWWPRGRGPAGILWPRFGLKGRTLLKDLHSVTGFWVSTLALVLLVTGLPWASVWGDAFKAVRSATGTMQGPQDWATRAGSGSAMAQPELAAAPVGTVPPGHKHHDHDHATVGDADITATPQPAVPLSSTVTRAQAESLAFPVVVQPPGISGRFGAPASEHWVVRSDAQNRPLRVTIQYSAITGNEVGRETFAEQHIIDRAVGYGIAWHEGQLFGWINQAIGVLTALALITVAVTGTLMWWRRRPEGVLGAPPVPAMPDGMLMRGLVAILIGLAILLPVLALSLLAVFLLERLVLRFTVGGRRWLGLVPA
ncbi:MAG: PepSY domain-containing protein [Sphingopyxis sp.]|nr:PepSY domain-containing protein [Sphingopyxis sp.]